MTKTSPLQYKIGKPSGWDENAHPRDRKGRFIETGAEVRIWGGQLGRVLRNVGNGKIEVERADGNKVIVHRNYLTVTARPNGEEPTAVESEDVAEAPVVEASPDAVEVPELADGDAEALPDRGEAPDQLVSNPVVGQPAGDFSVGEYIDGPSTIDGWVVGATESGGPIVRTEDGKDWPLLPDAEMVRDAPESPAMPEGLIPARRSRFARPDGSTPATAPSVDEQAPQGASDRNRARDMADEELDSEDEPEFQRHDEVKLPDGRNGVIVSVDGDTATLVRRGTEFTAPLSDLTMRRSGALARRLELEEQEVSPDQQEWLDGLQDGELVTISLTASDGSIRPQTVTFRSASKDEDSGRIDVTYTGPDGREGTYSPASGEAPQRATSVSVGDRVRTPRGQLGTVTSVDGPQATVRTTRGRSVYEQEWSVSALEVDSSDVLEVDGGNEAAAPDPAPEAPSASEFEPITDAEFETHVRPYVEEDWERTNGRPPQSDEDYAEVEQWAGYARENMNGDPSSIHFRHDPSVSDATASARHRAEFERQQNSTPESDPTPGAIDTTGRPDVADMDDASLRAEYEALDLQIESFDIEGAALAEVDMTAIRPDTPEIAAARVRRNELGEEMDARASRARQQSGDDAGQQGIESAPSEPVNLLYQRNPQSLAGNQARDHDFGQDVEPSGRYMTQRTEGFSAPDGWESGEVRFEKPLHMNWGSGSYSDEDNWKRRLSDHYGGLTGEALSDAVRADGYDAIITHEKIRGNDSISEIVDLSQGRAEVTPAVERDSEGRGRYTGSATHEPGPIIGADARAPMLTDPDSPEFDQRFGADIKRFEANGQNFRLIHDGLATYVSVQQPSGKYKAVGYLRTHGSGETSGIYVDGAYRRNGLGSQMRDFHRERGGLVRHSTAISTEGAALANADPDDPDFPSPEARDAVIAAGLDPDRTLVQRYGSGYRMWMDPKGFQPGDKVPTRTSGTRVWLGATEGSEVEIREVESVNLGGSRPTARMTDGSEVLLGSSPIVVRDEFIPDRPTIITNRPKPTGSAMQDHDVATLRTMAVDGNLRFMDREAARDELRRREEPLNPETPEILSSESIAELALPEAVRRYEGVMQAYNEGSYRTDLTNEHGAYADELGDRIGELRSEADLWGLQGSLSSISDDELRSRIETLRFLADERANTSRDLSRDRDGDALIRRYESTLRNRSRGPAAPRPNAPLKTTSPSAVADSIVARTGDPDIRDAVAAILQPTMRSINGIYPDEGWRQINAHPDAASIGPLLYTLRSGALGKRWDRQRADEAMERFNAGDTTLPIHAMGTTIGFDVLDMDAPLTIPAATKRVTGEVISVPDGGSGGGHVVIRDANGETHALAVSPDQRLDSAPKVEAPQSSLPAVPDDVTDLDDEAIASLVREIDDAIPQVERGGSQHQSLISQRARLADETRRRQDAVTVTPAAPVDLSTSTTTLRNLAPGDTVVLDGSVGQIVSIDPSGSTVEFTYRDADGNTTLHFGDASMTVGKVNGEEVIETPAPMLPSPGEREAQVLAGNLIPGDTLWLNGQKVTVTKTAPIDDDLVSITIQYADRKTMTFPFGKEAPLDRADDAFLPDPSPIGKDTPTSRPILYTYQRRNIVALGLDADGDPMVAEAARRIRKRQPLPPEQSAALARRLSEMAEAPGVKPQRQRMLLRLAAANNAASIEAGGRGVDLPEMPNADRVTKSSPNEIGAGDRVAIPTGKGRQVIFGRVTESRSMMGGRLTEVTIEDADGVQTKHLLTRKTDTYVLPDLPEGKKVPTPPEARPEVIDAADLRVGDKVLTTGIPGVIDKEQREAAVVEVRQNEDGTSTAIIDARSYYSGEDGQRIAADSGENVIRTARGDQSADQPFDSVLPEFSPTDVTPSDLRSGDWVSLLPTKYTEDRTVGYVKSVNAADVDGTPGHVVSIVTPNGRSINIVILDGEDRSIQRLASADDNVGPAIERAAADSAIRAERDAVVARINEATKTWLDDPVSAMQRSGTEVEDDIDAALDGFESAFNGVNKTIATTHIRDHLYRALTGAEPRSFEERFRASQQAGNAGDPMEKRAEEIATQIVEARISQITQALRAARPTRPGQSRLEAIKALASEFSRGERDGDRNVGAIVTSMIRGRMALSEAGDIEAGERQIDTTPAPTGSIVDRMAAYKAQFGGATFGHSQTEEYGYGEMDIDTLESGTVPEVVKIVRPKKDVAADGGPGETAMHHLAVVKAAGADLNAELERRVQEAAKSLPDRDAVAAKRDEHQEEYRRLGAEEDAVFEAALDRAAKANGIPQGWGWALYDGDDYIREMTGEPPVKFRIKLREIADADPEVLAHAKRKREALTAYRELAQIWKNHDQRMAELRANNLREMLNEIRGTGGQSLEYNAVGLKRFERLSTPYSADRSKASKENFAAMKYAESNYPTEWLEKLSKRPPLGLGTASDGRGFFERTSWVLRLSKEDNRNNADWVPPRGRVATHELGHAMEVTVPGLSESESAFLWSRTSNGEIGSRSRLKSVKVDVNRAYPDDFQNKYSGKDYEDGIAFELFTTGIESLFGGSSFLNNDDEYRNWVLGTLALI